MRYTERKSALSVRCLKSICERLSCLRKLYLCRNLLKSAAGIESDSIHKLLKSIGRVVEILDSLVESICGIVTKHILEVTECNGTVVELLGALYLIVA